jgi:hypothetical protein
MTVTLRFVIPDDQYQLDMALLGAKLALAVMALDETLSQVADRENDDKAIHAQRWRDVLWEALRDEGIMREMIER